MISKIKLYNERGKLIEIVNVNNPYSEPKTKFKLKTKSFNIDDKDRGFVKNALENLNINSSIGEFLVGSE
jgi:hypothetical protein